MTIAKRGGPIRRYVTRLLATGALLGMYATGMLATSGLMLGAGVSPAMAQRGQRGGNRGQRGGNRGQRGGNRGQRGGNRGGGRGRGRGGGNLGTAVGVGIGAAIIGGVIASEAARANDRNAVEECARRFRSYDRATREYRTRDGQYVPCP